MNITKIKLNKAYRIQNLEIIYKLEKEMNFMMMLEIRLKNV